VQWLAAETQPTMLSTSTHCKSPSERASGRLERSLGPALCLALAACGAPPRTTPLAVDGNMAHAVYFDLKDPRDSAALMRDCRARLADIPGVRALEVGERCTDFKTPRNDQDFEVALWVLFDDRAAHDGYQVHPQHRALVEAWTPKLAGIEVFDAWVSR
jgi:hypothetical protein